MNLLERMLRPRAAFTEPPFWSRPEQIRWTSGVRDREDIEANFTSYVQHGYKANGIVFACILARLLVFSEARFIWQRLAHGRATDVFGDQALALLENPWPNGTTRELLARMEQDTSLAGNFYATIVGEGEKRRIRRLRPDWVTIVTGSPDDDPFSLEAEPVAYIYEPRVGMNKSKPVILSAARVSHWSPIPDPEAQWRGMSWLTPVLTEISADSAATRHKRKFFENGAVPGFAITYDKEISKEAFDLFVEAFKESHTGVEQAYKTLHLGGGADVKPVGTNLQQLDFKVSQGSGETRVAAAAGVHPVIVGLSEGLQGSSLNAGNFGAARRRFTDGTVRPLWGSAAAAIEKLAQPKPTGPVRLWYDDRDIPFLREDATEAAAVRTQDATALETLIRAGYTPDSARDAVISGDFRKLAHTGLVSVQLAEPGSTSPAPTP